MPTVEEKPARALKLYDCSSCLCLNKDYRGFDCNLGYTTEFKKSADGNWHQVSSDCRLLEIKTRDGVITPDFISSLTKD